MRVFVNGGNVEGALKILKRKLQREGVYRLFKEGKFFQKPSTKRAIKNAQNRRRAKKAAAGK